MYEEIKIIEEMWISEKPKEGEIGLKLFKAGDGHIIIKEISDSGIIKNEIMIEKSEIETLKKSLEWG